MVPFPSVPETILEEEKEEEEEIDKEEEVPLQRRTQIARATLQERRRSSIGTSPSIPAGPLEVSSLEDKVQKWVNDQSEEGDDIFKMLDFNFMHVGTKLIGGKIVNIYRGESQ